MERCDVYLGGLQPVPIQCKEDAYPRHADHVGTTADGEEVAFPE